MDGEVIAIEDGDETTLGLEEEDIGDDGTIAVTTIGETSVVAAEAVVVIGIVDTIDLACLVETLEETAVEERDIGEETDDLVGGYLEELGVAVERLDVAVRAGSEATLLPFSSSMARLRVAKKRFWRMAL